MKIIRGLQNFNDRFDNLCLSMGNFDGLHLGHKRIIDSMRERAFKINGKSCILTFSPHPRWVLMPNISTKLLTTLHERVRILSEWGIDILILVRFDKGLASMKPENFVDEVLFKKLHIREIFVAEGFTFGHKKSGNTDILKTLGEKYGFILNMTDLLKDKGTIISSTLIRNKIINGEIEEANRLLGYNYGITGKVIKGYGRGVQMGYPTANLKIISKVLPPKGVYLVNVEAQGRHLTGIANIGNKPTFNKDGVMGIEVYILDFHEDLYGRGLQMSFLKWLRPEIAFPTKEELAAQINFDIQKAYQWKKEHTNSMK